MVSVVLTEDPEDLRKKRKEQWWGAYNDTKWFVIEPMAFWKAACPAASPRRTAHGWTPSTRHPRRFDGCTALLLLVLAFYIPFSIAFLDVGDFIWFDWYQLVWFSVDILLSFCSPYENEEGWVTNPKWIAAEYFQCFFWVDTISTFPFVLVLGASSGASPLTKLLKMPRLIKALRVLKMTKLTRAYHLDEVISQLATHLHVPPNAATCVEINQCVGCTRQFFTKSFLSHDAAVLAPSSDEESASPRHRAGGASMAWRTTRRFSTNAP